MQAGALGSTPTMMLMRSDVSHASLVGSAGLVLGGSLLSDNDFLQSYQEMGVLGGQSHEKLQSSHNESNCTSVLA